MLLLSFQQVFVEKRGSNFNPYVRSELFYPYQLDESICHGIFLFILLHLE